MFDFFNGEPLRRRVGEKFKTIERHQDTKNSKRIQIKNVF